MKTLEQFIKENNGKQVEVTGSANAKFQCVDLANAYIRDVLGFPIVEWTNAQDFPKKCLPPNYEYVLNSATGFPLKGDIVIWSSKDNVGHIAICVEDGNTKNFKSFDQNWSKPLYCMLETHVYTGTNHKVIGWLRPNVIDLDNNMTEEQKRILDFIGNRTEGDVREAFGALADMPNRDEQIRILNERISFYETKIKELETTIDVLNRRIEGYSKTIDDWQSDFRTANENLQTAEEALTLMTAEKNQYRKWYEVKLEEIKTLDSMTAWKHIIWGVKKLFVK